MIVPFECSFCGELIEREGTFVSGCSGTLCMLCLELALHLANEFPPQEDVPESTRCLLCERVRSEALIFVQGPVAAVCNFCFERAWKPPGWAVYDPTLVCPFCYRPLPECSEVVQGVNASICSECIVHCLGFLQISWSVLLMFFPQAREAEKTPHRLLCCSICANQKSLGRLFSTLNEALDTIPLGKPLICEDCLTECEVGFVWIFPPHWLAVSLEELAPISRKLAVLLKFKEVEEIVRRDNSWESYLCKLRSDLVAILGYGTDRFSDRLVRRFAIKAATDVGEDLLGSILDAAQNSNNKMQRTNALVVAFRIAPEDARVRGLLEAIDKNREAWELRPIIGNLTESELPWVADLVDRLTQGLSPDSDPPEESTPNVGEKELRQLPAWIRCVLDLPQPV
jgi:hypothetical protein